MFCFPLSFPQRCTALSCEGSIWLLGAIPGWSTWHQSKVYMLVTQELCLGGSGQAQGRAVDQQPGWSLPCAPRDLAVTVRMIGTERCRGCSYSEGPAPGPGACRAAPCPRLAALLAPKCSNATEKPLLARCSQETPLCLQRMQHLTRSSPASEGLCWRARCACQCYTDPDVPSVAKDFWEEVFVEKDLPFSFLFQ